MKKFDVYRSLHTLHDTTVNDSFKDQLAHDLFVWARDDDEAFKMSQFYLSKGINNRDFGRWCESHDNLRFAKEAALELIGNRREIGGLKKKFDSSIVLTSMAKYDPEWKALAEWRARLKAEYEQKKAETNLNVTMENYQSQETPEQVARRSRNGTK